MIIWLHLYVIMLYLGYTAEDLVIKFFFGLWAFVSLWAAIGSYDNLRFRIEVLEKGR